jgi:hypothetical protein
MDSIFFLLHTAEVLAFHSYDKSPFEVLSEIVQLQQRRAAEERRAVPRPIPLPQVCSVVEIPESLLTGLKFTTLPTRQADAGPPEANQAPLDAGLIPGPPERAHAGYFARVR